MNGKSNMPLLSGLRLWDGAFGSSHDCSSEMLYEVVGFSTGSMIL